MAQSGWRLPDELLKRVRVRAAEDGVRQNAWVGRALESALSAAGEVPASGGGPARPVPSAAPIRASAPVPTVQRGNSDALAKQARLNKEKGL